MKRLALVFLLACSKPTSSTADAATTTQAATASAPEVVVDAGPKVKRYTAAFAHFEKDRLFECVDLTAEFPDTSDAGADLISKLSKSLEKGTTKIPEACSKQFADRAVLATCTMHEERDGGIGFVEVQSSFFDYKDVGLTDEHMADCMKSKGKWAAISRDSTEWQRAKLEHDRRALRKNLDKLNE